MRPAPRIQRLHLATLSSDQVRAVWELWHHVFPRPGVTLEHRLAQFLGSALGKTGELFVALEGEKPVATACTFAREIRTPRGLLTVQALAGVCSAPERRGDGLGVAITRAAFGEIDAGRFPLSLFQTNVPDFYAKLGARIVTNPFINSRFDPADPAQIGRGTREKPWWSTHAMIYPGTFDWPEGEIDLLGLGY